MYDFDRTIIYKCIHFKNIFYETKGNNEFIICYIFNILSLKEMYTIKMNKMIFLMTDN